MRRWILRRKVHYTTQVEGSGNIYLFVIFNQIPKLKYRTIRSHLKSYTEIIKLRAVANITTPDTGMENSQPTYSAITSQEVASCLKQNYGSSKKADYADADVESSGTYSAAASPYWAGPVQKAAASKEGSSTAGFSPLVAFCFTINYILGAGFLTIPWAFVQSGLVLSSIMLIISAVGTDIAKDL